jgi:ADP-heptose:LPS heptosyltransferase
MKKIEILLKKILLNLLLIFSKRRTKSDKQIADRNSNVLFIRLNRIGDALVTTPLLTQVKQQIGCKIFVLADKKNHFIFEHCPAVDETFIYKKGLSGLKEIKSLIREKNIHTIVDLHDDVSFSVSYVLRSVKVKQVFGLKKKTKKLYTHTVSKLDPAKHHIIERTLEISKLFGLTPDYKNANVNYKFNSDSLKIADEFLTPLKDKFLLGINITAGSDARFWGRNNFIRLIELLKNYKLNYLLFTNNEYYQTAKEITTEKNIFPPNQDFDIFAAGISKLNMLFTPDTSVVHIASMMKMPVFGLYVKYKTHDMIWSPYNTDFDSVITEEPILHNVSFEEVKNKFIPFLEKHLNV